MRYTVGTVYPFLIIQYDVRRPDGSIYSACSNMLSRAYQPFDSSHELKGTQVQMLKCVEHHKVPNYWDESKPPKLDCDGFIFQDTAGNRWFNQYPRASYGQVTDTQDRVVHRQPNADEGDGVQLYKEGRIVLELEDAFARLEEIHHGIYLYSATPEEAVLDTSTWSRRYCEPPVAQALQDLAAKVQAAIEEAAGRKITITQHYYHIKGDPKPKALPGRYDAQWAEEVSQ